MIIFGPPYKVELPPEQIHFITGLTVNTINPYTFTPDSGFPYTAFAGAFFQIEIDGAVPVSGAYGFNVNDPAVSVSDSRRQSQWPGSGCENTDSVRGVYLCPQQQ